MNGRDLKIEWHTEKRKIKDLKLFLGNPRKANEKQIADLDKSLEKFNVAEPLVINTDGEVIGGNFRLSRLKEKGIEEVDVRVPSRTLTRKEAEELNIRLNKNTAEFDYDLLANFSEELLNEVGFESEELDKIFNLEATEDDFDAQAEYEKIKEPLIKRGDLFQLNSHRLLCGDSTLKEDVAKLMGGEKADMVFTDPPYGIDLETDFASIHKGHLISCSGKHNKIIGDEKNGIFKKVIGLIVRNNFGGEQIII